MADHIDIDVEDLAGWLERQPDDRLWVVDGDVRISERVGMPCPGAELASVLKKLGGRLRVTNLGSAANATDIAALAGKEAGGPIFKLAWLKDNRVGEPYYLFEDTETEEVLRETLATERESAPAGH